MTVDLSSQSSVRAAAKEVLSWPDVPQIDIIVNNAGIMNVPELTLTSDNIESHFATNHIGHFLLTNLLIPKLLTAAQSSPTRGATRIINVSSSSFRDGGVRFSDINFHHPQNHLPPDERHIVENLRMVNGSYDPDIDTYTPSGAYAQSKTANVLFSVELNRRLYESHGILSVALHPGLIWTELTRLFTQERVDRVKAFEAQGFITAKTPGAGAATSLVAAVDPKLGAKGGVAAGEGEGWVTFLEDCQVAERPVPEFGGSEPAKRLWKLSEELVGEKFDR